MKGTHAMNKSRTKEMPKVNNVLFAVIAAALLANPIHVLVQQPTTLAPPEVTAPESTLGRSMREG